MTLGINRKVCLLFLNLTKLVLEEEQKIFLHLFLIFSKINHYIGIHIRQEGHFQILFLLYFVYYQSFHLLPLP